MADHDELTDALAGIDAPDSSARLEQTVAEARALPAGNGSRRVSARPLAAAVAVVLAALLALTGPGQEAASAVGRLVGIGDEPSAPRRAGNERAAVVVGVGTTAGGDPYELVASVLEVGTRERPDEVCVTIDVLSEPGPGGGSCLTRDSNRAVERDGIWAGALPSTETSTDQVSGFTATGADAVEVRIGDEGSAIEAEVVAIDQATLDRLELEREPFQYFQAPLPDGALERAQGVGVEVTALRDGKRLRTAEAFLPSLAMIDAIREADREADSAREALREQGERCLERRLKSPPPECEPFLAGPAPGEPEPITPP